MRTAGRGTHRTFTRREALKGFGIAAASVMSIGVGRSGASFAAGRPNLLRLGYDAEPNIMDPALST